MMFWKLALLLSSGEIIQPNQLGVLGIEKKLSSGLI
jgi:hypothetical protein